MPRFLTHYELRVNYEQMLNARLRQYGAATFGSLRRREERLQRFVDMERRHDQARLRLEQARLEAQEAVRQRAHQRANEILAEAEESYLVARLWAAIQNGFVKATRG
jgi:hypothetical protein